MKFQKKIIFGLTKKKPKKNLGLQKKLPFAHHCGKGMNTNLKQSLFVTIV